MFRPRGGSGIMNHAPGCWQLTDDVLAAGATDVVLYSDPTNPTSNALYQRLGYVRIADFTGYKFSYCTPEAA